MKLREKKMGKCIMCSFNVEDVGYTNYSALTESKSIFALFHIMIDDGLHGSGHLLNSLETYLKICTVHFV